MQGGVTRSVRGGGDGPMMGRERKTGKRSAYHHPAGLSPPPAVDPHDPHPRVMCGAVRSREASGGVGGRYSPACWDGVPVAGGAIR